MPANKQEIIQFLQHAFPQTDDKFTIDTVGHKSAVLTYHINESSLRPGGTVSGPTLMAAADLALYIALLGEIGIVALAVTTNLNITFLKKPSGQHDIQAQCKLMKVGRTLAVGEVYLYSQGDDEPVAHVVGTYAIPQQEKSP